MAIVILIELRITRMVTMPAFVTTNSVVTPAGKLTAGFDGLNTDKVQVLNESFAAAWPGVNRQAHHRIGRGRVSYGVGAAWARQTLSIEKNVKRKRIPGTKGDDQVRV
ncbi:MAG: hypothetical protein ABSB78_05170 [Bacteroidota bacterium]